MRFVVYLVAVLAAAGIVYYVGGSGEKQVTDATVSDPSVNEATTTAAVETATTEPVVEGDVQLISLKVPGMHCQFACYPNVKKTLEASTGVAEVNLAEQADEGSIDNPVVLIKAGENFDLDKAIDLLAAKGFAGAAVVE